jgi:cysteine desulfurase family protein (TIGR01976 family)
MFDPASVRGQFPALNQIINNVTPIFFDGPGGTQIPQSVLDAMTKYLGFSNANLLKSPFFAVQETHRVVKEAREHAAAFMNAPSPENIVFGANMSSITAHFSRSIAREWKEGDEIIVTALDHFANISFWQQAAEERGVKCHVVKLNPDECTVDYGHFEKLVSKKTKFIAFGAASNACGTRSDVTRTMKLAKSVGAMTYLDWVHAAPHYLPDVQTIGCDFMVLSAYKFFGPHIGVLYGKKVHLERLKAFKIAPALETPPDKWETGTKNFEALAGFIAAIQYLSSLGEGDSLRAKLASSYMNVAAYEQEWSKLFLNNISHIKGIKVHGITDLKRLGERTSTFAITMDGHTPQEVSDHLAKHNISAGAGSFYANGITDTLKLTDKGGIVRIGCIHYNTFAEIERLLEVLS